MDSKKNQYHRFVLLSFLPPGIFRVWEGTVFAMKTDYKVKRVALTSVLEL